MIDLPGVIPVALSFLSNVFTCSPDSQIPFIRTYKPVSGVYMVKINNAPMYDLEPYITEELTTVKDVFDKNSFKVVINAGFFDPNNGKTISYVVKDKEIVLDPSKNEALTENPNLKPYLDKILNRSEFRVLKCDGKTEYDIAYHNDPVNDKCEIQHSIQAGPILGDKLDLEKEYFVVTKDGKLERDSISATKKVARTAIGLKSNDVYLFIVTDKNPMTIEELSELMKKKGMEKSMAFDGGSSTSFENGLISVTSIGDGLGRKVKSFLIVK